jgi:hypothetical protein
VTSARSRADSILERAARTWWDRQGSGDSGVPLSVIAALALADKIDTQTLLASGDDQIVKSMGEVWAAFWLRRPDLAIRCEPLAGWLNDDPIRPGLVKAAAAVARTAVKAGIGDLLGDHLLDYDILGHAYVLMRPQSAIQARGEYYTPEHVCKMMAMMTLGSKGQGLVPGMSIAEPAAGTGGMVRAAAEVIREQGMDPADFIWVVNDISPLVSAALAVNCHLWGLGPNVIVKAADTLADPDWYRQAWTEQQEVIAYRDELVGTAGIIGAIGAVQRLIDPDPARPAPEPGVPDVVLPADGSLFDLPESEAPTSLGPGGRASNGRRRPVGPSPDDDPDALALF